MGSCLESKQRAKLKFEIQREMVRDSRSRGGGKGWVLVAPVSPPKHLLSLGLSLCLCCCVLCQTHPINSKSKKNRNIFFFRQNRMNTPKSDCPTQVNVAYLHDGLSLSSVNF